MRPARWACSFSDGADIPLKQAAILIVDDHEILRFGLRSMLSAMEVTSVEVLEAGSLAEGLSVFAERDDQIVLVLLDLNLPDSKGLTALQSFRRMHPQARIVVLSGSVDEAIAGEARTLGAFRFIHKASDVEAVGQLVAHETQAWRQRGERPECPQRSVSEHMDKRMRLSPRELEILDLLLQGQSNQEIADSTKLRMGTIKNYISGLLVVFDATSRSKLISLFR
jgi:DNA-binding NarL/FixJ family response regulator